MVLCSHTPSANKTNPPVSVKIETYDIGDKKVARIHVPKSRQLVSTLEGLLQHLRLMANGKPEAVPFYPHEFIQRQSALGLIDSSAMPILELTVKDLNPIERQRIREAVKLYREDSALLSLTDEELDRDYARLGAIHVQIEDNGLSISNPGGFNDSA